MSSEDTLRQQAFVILSPLKSGTEDVVRLGAALEAIAAERNALIAAVKRGINSVPESCRLNVDFLMHSICKEIGYP